MSRCFIFALPLSICMMPATTVASSGTGMGAKLKELTASCRDNFEDESLEDATVVNDLRNGYVSIAGAYPTCGCECSATAAAFKTAAGSYRYIAFESDDCSWMTSLKGDWGKVLAPWVYREFGSKLAGYEGPAVFALKPLIPRKGTDLEVRLRLLPLRFKMSCEGGVCWSVADSGVGAEVGYDDPADVDLRYAQYRKAEYDTVVFKWNRKTAKFEVKRKSKLKHVDRESFAAACGTWGPLC